MIRKCFRFSFLFCFLLVLVCFGGLISLFKFTFGDRISCILFWFLFIVIHCNKSIYVKKGLENKFWLCSFEDLQMIFIFRNIFWYFFFPEGGCDILIFACFCCCWYYWYELMLLDMKKNYRSKCIHRVQWIYRYTCAELCLIFICRLKIGLFVSCNANDCWYRDDFLKERCMEYAWNVKNKRHSH